MTPHMACKLSKEDQSMPHYISGKCNCALLAATSGMTNRLLQVIVRSNSYIHAIQKMQRALYEFQIRGVKTNILFLENVLRHPEFLSGQATTSFIDENPQLFDFHQDAGSQSSGVLTYLADLVSSCIQTSHCMHAWLCFFCDDA